MSAVVKISVVVPVFNPGAAFEECVDSLLAQTLHADEHELIFVDDGSTDATPARLDELAAEHEHVHVSHIPNSGWPGRPRNLGLDAAQGEYVLFVDNDDWLEPETLERLYATARRDDADVVIGKVVGHGKPVPPTLFAENRSNVGMEYPPMAWLLTPHRLFRRALLEDAGLRFPEGRRRLEDHVFVLAAQFRAERTSILADYPGYHWVLRDRSTNASAELFDAEIYYGNLREVLDLIDANTEPGRLRDRLYLRYLRGKVLNRVGGPLFYKRTPEVRRTRVAEIQGLVADRFPPALDERLPFVMRARMARVRNGTVEQLETLAEMEEQITLQLVARDVRVTDDAFELSLRAYVDDPAGMLRFEDGVWQAPDDVDVPPLTQQDALDATDVTLQLRPIGQEERFMIPATVRPQPFGGRSNTIDVDARIPVATAATGLPLAAGDFVLSATVYVAGIRQLATVVHGRRSPTLVLRVGRDGRPAVVKPGRRQRIAALVPRRARRAARSAVRRTRELRSRHG